MDYQSLHMKTVVELRKLAKDAGVKVPAGTNKTTLIQLLLESEKPAAPKPAKADAPKAEKPAAPKPAKPAEAAKDQKPKRGPGRPRTRREPTEAKPAQKQEAKPAAKQEAKPAAKQDAKPAQKQEAKPAVKQEVKPAVKQDAKPAAKQDAKPEQKQEVKPAEKPEAKPVAEAPKPAQPPRAASPAHGSFRPANAAGEDNARPAQRTFQNRAPSRPAPARAEQSYAGEYRTSNPAAGELLASGDCGEGAGVLEIQPDGYGFLRAENCLPGPNDVYISIAQIRRFNLRNGDLVAGKTRPQREGDRYSAILYITQINGESPEKALERPRFEDLVPIYPDERLRLEPAEGKGDLSLRLVDMLAPIGKGQRGMIVSQPKAGKTTLLKKLANAITGQYPDVHLIVLLIDERPEEVTDMQRSIQGEVIYSTFDEEPEHHTRVSEMVLARAQRLVEMGKDVVVLLDSITRLARAYNLTITPTGRSLSGGLDPGALFKPKRFFGAARNIENGGSLTIIATALVDTGSRMDDIIFEEFKGTGNMELHLDRKLSDRRVFPAIDLLKSGTRREELLLSEEEMNGEYQVRKMLNGRQQEMYEQLIELMTKTSDNADFFNRLKGWLAVYEKEGYSLGR